MKVFLDDFRHPSVCVNYMHPRIGAAAALYSTDWVIVRNYAQFIDCIEKNYAGITHVSFDHDLAEIHYDPSTWKESFKYDEETGYDCAEWMIDFYQSKQLPLPVCFVHSQNPVGTERINYLLLKHKP